MSDPIRPNTEPIPPPLEESRATPFDRLDGLMKELRSESLIDRASQLSSESPDNQLVAVRLGVATSLYTALRCKHAATARHSLRVALASSAWATEMGLSDEHRDAIEVAALLHDIGMIGLPDKVIHKQGRVTSSEADAILRARRMSVDILVGSCEDPEILEIIENVGAWYDGSRSGYHLTGEAIPLGARMITITEAFDAMTTTSVYQSAMTHERAMSELYACAGTQFSPDLVQSFDKFFHSKKAKTQADVARRWLTDLDPESVDSCWELQTTAAPLPSNTTDRKFQEKLLDDMHDAVIFLDSDHRIIRWNCGAERLTGIAAGSVLQEQYACELLKLRDDKGVSLTRNCCDECPIGCTFSSGVSTFRRMTIRGRKEENAPVNCHVSPVNDESGNRLGAVVVLHDASPQVSWEARCHNLMEKAKLDPLTRLANRAEFDRVQEVFVKTHEQQDMPCSLIMCDIDHFKHVNDTFGHQAGDDVIHAIAGLLRDAERPGDIVARYGGEEFVILCADCNAAAATSRAEQIRLAFSRFSHTSLGGQAATASFGVTEFQPGDTPETMIRRSDRGLLTAKSQGRNMVVQLGSGREQETDREHAAATDKPKPGQRDDTALSQLIHVPAPLDVVLRKLRGFVADHRARIIRADKNLNRVWMGISHAPSEGRRQSDRPTELRILLEMSPDDPMFVSEGSDDTPDDTPDDSSACELTRIRVTIARAGGRNRRKSDHHERGNDLLASLRSYLTASPAGPVQFTNVPQFPKERGLAAWLRGFRIIARRADDTA